MHAKLRLQNLVVCNRVKYFYIDLYECRINESLRLQNKTFMQHRHRINVFVYRINTNTLLQCNAIGEL
jgi:hypothetical protein